MRMMDELKHMFLYSADKKVYAPIDEKDKKRNSAILLLTPKLEESIKLMNLPYVYNPNLFTSFFVDRNVMAYIDNEGVANLDFDEQQEAQISESMVGLWNSKCEFKFDDKASIVDQRTIEDVYNKKTTDKIRISFNIKKLPEKIKVVVHPTVTKLRESAPKKVASIFSNHEYSYSYNGEIHILSKYVYDQDRMCGPYEKYIEAELISCILSMYNDELPLMVVKSIGLVMSGCYTWMKDNDTDIDDGLPEWKFAFTVNRLVDKQGKQILDRYIRTGDIYIFTKFIAKSSLIGLQDLLFEETLSYFDRQRLLPSEFGIPDKRKYPMPDEEHVRAAIKMFNSCDPDDEKELAQAIIKKMKKFGVTDVKVSAANRFKKYYNPDIKKETALLETSVNSKLSDEFKKRTHISLSKFKAENLNIKNTHDEYARDLRHVRINGQSFGEIFIDDKGELACFYMTEKKDDGHVWITALEIIPEYQGHGLSKQLLMRAMDYFNATHLSVNKKNEVAIKIYERDFETYEETDNMLFMRLKGKSYNEATKYDFSSMSKDVHTIINNLSKEDSNHIGDGYWVDSNHIIYRKVEYKNGNPIGFIDVYLLPKFKRTGLVVLAVLDDYKHQGIGKKLVNSAKQMLNSNSDIDKLRWLADSDNEASIHMATSLGFKLNSETKDEKEFIYESYLFNRDDIQYNFNIWKPGAHNILYVTGLSGGGKTTIATELSKQYNAIYIELDRIEATYSFINNPNPNRADENYIAEYAKSIHLSKDPKKMNNDEYEKYFFGCFEYIKSQMQKDSDSLYVVEGIQVIKIARNDNSVFNEPMIIKGTSMLTSILRRLKRDNEIRIGGKTNVLNAIDWYLDQEYSLGCLRTAAKHYNESTVLNELANISDDKIVVGTDFHFVGYDGKKENIILKSDSYIEGIIKKQNELVGRDGIFIFLGDLLYKGFHNEYDMPGTMKKKAIEYIKRFKGKYKILIRGNHDKLPDEFYINTLGFTHVCQSLLYDNILFTHQPEIVQKPMVNVHGHIHGTGLYVEEKPANYADVWAIAGEKYRMDTLPNILNKQEEYEKTIKQAPNIKRADPYQFIEGDRLKLNQIVTESFVNTNYGDILKICSHLSQEELKRITFYDTYRDSQFVIKRIIHRINGEPVGFLDVYQFPSKPEIAQIVIAVDNRYHSQGIGDAMVNELMNSKLENSHDFEMFYWTAHPENDASKNLALKHGFVDCCYMDKYGRMVYTKRVKDRKGLWEEIPEYLKPISGQEYFAMDECAFVTESFAIFNEADDKYSDKLRRYLYAERIKNNKGVLEIYDRIKASNPGIRKMYLKIGMYKKANLFVDLSYYHSVFLEKNIYKLDKAVNFYFDFLNRLINNPEIDSEYKKKTIFIPVDAGVWPVQPNTDITDYKKNLNPISIIVRLVRTNPGLLKKVWRKKDIVFVGSRGYFKIDFDKFEVKNIARLKTNLRKLMSNTEPVEDEYETDELDRDTKSGQDASITTKNVDSKKAMAAKMIDKIETGTNIKIDDVSAAVVKPDDKTQEEFFAPSMHLHMQPNLIPIESETAKKEFGSAIIIIDPEGPDGYQKLKGIESYCMP